jgi:structural maintenance of chromosome 1
VNITTSSFLLDLDSSTASFKMPLQRLELNNFKSYRGNQVSTQVYADLTLKVIDFGDAPFMCIIGPNGAGKSNLMDAISFVLGVKSAQLRSTQLKDLIYRGRKAARGSDEETMDVDEPETLDLTQGTDARTAHVVAVYEDEKNKEWHFKRRCVGL